MCLVHMLVFSYLSNMFTVNYSCPRNTTLIMELTLLFVIMFLKVTTVISCPTFNCKYVDYSPETSLPLSCQICDGNFESFEWQQEIDAQWVTLVRCDEKSTESCFATPTGLSYNLIHRSEFLFSGTNFYLTINTTILEDSGNWRCVHNGQKPKESDICDVIVYSNLTATDINVEFSNEIIVGEAYDYRCSTPIASPFFETIWGHDGTNRTGLDNSNSNKLGIWNIDNSITLTHVTACPVITCYMDKSKGSVELSIGKHVSPSKCYYPAHIEWLNSSLPSEGGAIKLPHELVFSCVSSGDDPTITWYNATEPLDMDLFNRSDLFINGSFTYGQTQALQSTITWKVPTEGYTCADIDKYNGEYVCKSTSPAGSEITEDISRFEASIKYAPILKTNYSEYEAYLQTNVTLECEACASPKEVYAWSSANGRVFDEFINMTAITLTVSEEDFNDTFYCIVTNTAGSDLVTYKIYQMVTTTQPPTTEPPITTLPDINDTTETPGDQGSDNRQALIIANAVIWSLCGVVAVVLVCLALYHYKQIQEGNKYSDDNPLTENEVKPGTSGGEGEYADISCVSANGCGAVGKHSDDTYSEIPVAPARTSMAKALRQQQGTPKTKRTQAYAAPNSPVKARRQEISKHTPDRRPESAVDYSLVNNNTGAKEDQQRKKSPNQQAVVKPNSNGTKPPVSVKPNITSFRSSRSSNGGLISPDIKQAGPNYDNAQVNLYANCEQHAPTRNDDGTITYADLALQQEDPYEEGAPPVPTKHLNDQEPVQYASIKQNK